MRGYLLTCIVWSLAVQTGVAVDSKEQTGMSIESNGQIRTVVPQFEGGQLGMNVATVLNLKTWRTLRRQPIGGKVIWTHSTLTTNSHEEAERCARINRAQMILWGDATPFGHEVIVQCFLSIPEYDDGRTEYAEDWSVVLDCGDSKADVSVGLPRRRYEFSPIVLDKELVDRYSLPSSLKLYATKDAQIPVGEVGGSFTAKRHEGEYTYVQPDGGSPGWIHLPKLDSEVEIVNFTGGLMRLFRADYSGAIELLQKVSDTRAPTSVKIDALLLQALSKAKKKQDPLPMIREAIALNPHLQISVKYEIAALVSKYMAQSRSPERQREVAASLKQIISENEYLFSADDKWLAAARAATSCIADKPSAQ